MPLPKRQHSVGRGRRRRTHWKAKLGSLTVCSNCKKPGVPHQVCTFCGYYRGKPVVTIKVKEKKKG